jgi:hypothetical protein
LKKFVKWYLSYYGDNTPHESLVAWQPWWFELII